jgi:phage terminase large subunit GpA-like protein
MAKRSCKNRFQHFLLEGLVPVHAVGHEPDRDERQRKDRKSGATGDVPQLLMNVNRLKDMVAANVSRQERGPGYYHFPDWLVASFYDELTAETRTDKGWVNLAGRRNEAVDLCAYGEALGMWLKLPSIKWDRLPSWAKPIPVEKPAEAKEEEPADLAPRKPFVNARRSGWVKRW